MVAKLVVQILRAGVLISSAGFVLSTLTQVSMRFIFSSAPAWTEEASRFFFIYSVCFAGGLAARNREFIALDIVSKAIPEEFMKTFDRIAYALTVILFLVVGVYAIQYTAIGVSERSPGLGIPMAASFVGILILSISIIYTILTGHDSLKR